MSGCGSASVKFVDSIRSVWIAVNRSGFDMQRQRHPAIGEQHVPGDIAGPFGRQENSDVGHLVRPAHAPDRYPFPGLHRVIHTLVTFDKDRTGGNGVDPDP